GELMWRGHDAFGIGRAAELEIEKRNPADRALLDDPGLRTMASLFEEDARDIGGYPEAEIDRPAVAQFLRHAPRAPLVDAPFHEPEGGKRPEGLPRDRRIVRRLGRLPLLGRFDDIVDEDARHAHIM